MHREEAAVRGVGTGRRIAGRYALNERRAHLGSIEVWSALDSTLSREVSITLFPASFERAPAILDSARQSAAVNDHRLVRVLDMGTDGDVSWLVEESLSESSTIAELIARGPLPPEEARRIAGEIASGLDVAAARGLHHLHITPHSVRRTDGGLIKIAGLATAAALEGTVPPSAAAASRIDTAAIVAVMYAAMTTRWPLQPPVHGLEAAPRIVGGVAAPSEIALAVPPDLDAVCRATLNHDTGPQTPGELVKRIAPWSATIVRQVSPKGAPRAAARSGEPTQLIPGVADPAEQGGAFARAAAHHRQQREQERADRAASVRRRLEERRADPAFLDLPEALEDRRGPLEAPAPLIRPLPEGEGKHAKLILAIVAVLIVVALAFAIPTLQMMFAQSPAPRRPAPTSAPATSGRPGATSSAATPSASPSAITPVSVTAIDPQGDGKENNSAAPRAIDGEAATKWTSEGYRDSPDMGGQKEGVGLALRLPAGATVHAVTLTMGAPGQDVAVYTSDSATLKGATKIGEDTDMGTAATTMSAKQPVSDARYVIVWVTKAAQESANTYRASVAEVAVS